MAQAIKIVKLVNNEIIIGKFNEAHNSLDDVAVLQNVPTKEGMQMMLLPYGYPIENALGATISLTHTLYSFRNVPTDMVQKYFEMCEKIENAKKEAVEKAKETTIQ